MLSLLFMTKKKKRTLEEKVQLIQEGDTSLLNETIDQYKPFIAKTVSGVCKRYINESDDEFSIGLIAFHEAIEKYSPDRGSSLLSFSEVIIQRRVIDFIRKNARNQHSSLDYENNEADDESPGSKLENDLSLEEYTKKLDETKRRDEIIHFQQLLKDFELSFTDLVEQSPKHVDARKNAIQIAKILIEDEELKELLFENKRLPIKQLQQLVDVSRKTIERNRKYIIAIALVMSGDYHYMNDYIKGVLET